MRRDHPREAAEDRSGSSIEEIKAEHRKGKVRSRDRDQAVQVDSAPPQGDCSCHVRGRQGVQDKEERETHCRVELVCAHCVKRHQSSVSSALGDRHSIKGILTRWVTAIMKGEKRNGVSSGVLRPCSAEPTDQLTGVLFLPGHSISSSR